MTSIESTMSAARLALPSIDAIQALKGLPARRSPWIHVDQTMIDMFAQATGDRQWIHIDPDRAARELAGGRTLAHGFLVLSLVSPCFTSCFSFPNRKMSLNYGFDRLRFVSAVEAGSKLRAGFALNDFVDLGPRDLRTIWDVRLEIDGREKPALVGSWLVQMSYEDRP